MKKYKFPQFQIEIENPTISINLNTIGDKALDKLLSVDFLMVTDGAEFINRALDMPYTDTWEDGEVHDMVMDWLKQFEI